MGKKPPLTEIPLASSKIQKMINSNINAGSKQAEKLTKDNIKVNRELTKALKDLKKGLPSSLPSLDEFNRNRNRNARGKDQLLDPANPSRGFKSPTAKEGDKEAGREDYDQKPIFDKINKQASDSVKGIAELIDDVRNAIGGALLAGMAHGVAQGGYQNHLKIQQSLAANSGLDTPKNLKKASLGGAKYGFNRAETAELSKTQYRSAGGGTGKQFAAGLRATGLDVNELGEVLKSIRTAGLAASDTSSKGPLAKILRISTAAGIKDSLKGEFIKGVSAVANQSTANSKGEVNVENIAKLLGGLTKQYGGKNGGERAQDLLQRIDEGIKNPKGPWQEQMQMQARGWGIPGGGSKYLEAKKDMELGVNGMDGKAVQNLIQFSKEKTAGMDSLSLQNHLSQSMGLNSMHDAERLLKFDGDLEGLQKELDKMKAERKEESIGQTGSKNVKNLADSVVQTALLFDKAGNIGGKVASSFEALNRSTLTLSEKAIPQMEKAYLGFAKFIDNISSSSADMIKMIDSYKAAAEVFLETFTGRKADFGRGGAEPGKVIDVRVVNPPEQKSESLKPNPPRKKVEHNK